MRVCRNCKKRFEREEDGAIGTDCAWRCWPCHRAVFGGMEPPEEPFLPFECLGCGRPITREQDSDNLGLCDDCATEGI